MVRVNASGKSILIAPWGVGLNASGKSILIGIWGG